MSVLIKCNEVKMNIINDRILFKSKKKNKIECLIRNRREVKKKNNVHALNSDKWNVKKQLKMDETFKVD